MFRLFKVRGFGPFIAIAFLNAFSDLGHKIVIQNAIFKHYHALHEAALRAHASQSVLDDLSTTQIILTAIINALILLPMIALFSPTGHVADKYPKDRVIKRSAMVALPLFMLVALAYSQGWFEIAFGLTLLLGAQAAFYAPARVGYIRELVGAEQIASANAFLHGMGIIGILAGTALFSIFFEYLLPAGMTDISLMLVAMVPLGLAMVASTILEFSLSLRLTQKTEIDRTRSFDYGQYFTLRTMVSDLRIASRNPVIWRSIVGLAMFFGVGQVLLAVYPEYLGNVAGLTNAALVQGIIGVGGVGVVLGSLFAGKLSKNFIETGLVPIGAFGMAAMILLMPMLTNVPMLFGVLFLYGGFSGIFVVPLTSLVQFNSPDHEIGTVIASSGFTQNVICFIFLGVTVLASEILRVDSRPILYGLFAIVLLGSFYALYRLPQAFTRYVVSAILSQHYKLRVEGMKNIPATGGALLLGNHTNHLDWAMVQIATPRPIHFVMKRAIYTTPILTWAFKFFGVIPISGAGSREAIERIHTLLKDGELVALFPEGRLTRNGQLSEFHRGYEMAIEGLDVPIVPFYLRGLWESLFSFARRKLFRVTEGRDVSVTFGRPLRSPLTSESLKQRVMELSIGSWHRYAERCKPVHSAWLSAAKKGKGKVSVVNFDGTELSHTKLLAATLAFVPRLAKLLRGEKNVGLIVPPSSGSIITTLALLIKGKTLVNLNYTSGEQNIRQAIEMAGVKSVIVSRMFVEKLTGRGIDLSTALAGCRVIELEELRKSIGKAALVRSLIVGRVLPAALIRLFYFVRVRGEETAAILFSSGSESRPKGVELTHRNFIGNVKQLVSVLNPVPNETMLASLPLFHAFGLTGTTFLPLAEGLKIVCQPDPTDALAVAKLVAKHKVTLLLGTSTFLGLYARNPKVQPLMFQSVRWVVSGAEKLSENVQRIFLEKFGKEIYEGYGTTETTPVASVNVPDDLSSSDWTLQVGHRPGSVGLPLPGTAFKIVDPDTLAELPLGEAGLILIGGPQIMKGYLNDPERTASAIVEIESPLSGERIRWYKTGDKGKLDADGFLTIVDRYSRFAKVGGEMLSLTSIESAVRAAIPLDDLDVVAVGLPDDAKGERITLLIAGIEHEHTWIRQTLVESGMNPLMLPKTIVKVDGVPKLGTGKTDFAAAKALARELEECAIKS